ncbi:MAG TPA: carboxypeptidase-like regulatory domain-containing protein, partial [Verrucomicrobiae bacterium]|nr:carboxypeptidase-like regulatory domain-containing protein [Verrucomicrobiae bacterium]
MRLFKRVSVFVAGLLMVAGTACAQGVGASGDIKGTVTDPTGALLTNATVTATDVARGTKRSSASDNQGVYLITGLSPSTYSVSVEHAGFQTEVQKGVVVNVGLSVTLDFHLQVSGSSTSLEVTTEPPVVDTAAVGQSEVIDSQSIENL